MIRDWSLDLVIVNGENSAGGFGITEAIYQELLDAGADAITLGNHAWNQKEALVFIERAPRLIRPAELSAPYAGPRRRADRHQERQARAGHQRHGPRLHGAAQRSLRRGRRELDACPLREAADAIVVDFHGEATSEKQGMGFFCDGRVSLVVGTHTHVPTADHQILPGGTAYMSDAGMTGDYDFDHRHAEGRAAASLHHRHPLRPLRAGVRRGDAVAASRSRPTMRPGLALQIAPVRAGGRLEPAVPAFW